MYTNVTGYGGNFKSVVESDFQEAVNVQIATGYVSYDTVNYFRPVLENIVSDGGTAKLLLGMAFYEGLNERILSLLSEMSQNLESYNNGSGVYVAIDRKYHGKVYLFDSRESPKFYVGSSNFSSSGFSDNIECTVLVKDDITKNRIRTFLKFLFSDHNATSILKAEIPVPGTPRYIKRVESFSLLQNLEHYDPRTIDKNTLPLLEIPLARSVSQEKSNLNAYFGRGRWSRTTGIVKPRPWYEVEIITDISVNSDPLYPKGNFDAYTDDGYIIPMRTQGDYYKNIRSVNSLQIFGMWIKGKLQRKHALIPLTPVTQDTLIAYGNDTLRLYKISDNEYYMEF